MISTQPARGLTPLDGVSAWEFKGSLLQSTCVLMNGSVVALVALPECKNEFINLCSIRSTRKVIKKNISLKDPDKCEFIFAIGNLILVVGKKRGYLFDNNLNLQSIIQEKFRPGLFVIWDNNLIVAGKNSRFPRLYNLRNPS